MAPKSADSTLHILNGDATRPEFDRASIDGEVIVWREVMVEGPVTEDIRSEGFWEARRQYVEGTYGAPGKYQDTFMTQLQQLDDASQYEEVVLWFEFDLFCQINMLACLAYLQHNRISLVCLGNQLGGRWQGLGEIGAAEFSRLYEERLPLSSEDVQYAHEVWDVYTHDDAEKIKSLRKAHPTFVHLDRALQAHISRFPGPNGINAIEYDMLEVVKEGVTNEKQLIGKMLRNDPWLGFGDLQFERVLRSLGELIDSDLTLTEKAERVLEHQDRFPQPDEFLGGVYRPEFFRQTYG